ncbi:MAG: efflux RND transporter periplasmic adaptor subunit [Gammaproteobacteria bacterium]|jgi:RND family efflux transporter MFP subunit|nr:MAG: efflux RND transporter periplasmic adaptor subunit [Gammaproteobacteria bacterium]
MARTLKILLPVAFILVATIVALILIQSRPKAAQTAAPAPALLVTVASAAREPVRFVVRTQGAVSPRTETILVSEVAGQIVEVAPAFVSGGFFAKGDVLLRIDPRNYESAVKRASAGVAQARTQVATENALAGYAYEDWKRLRDVDDGTQEASDLTLRKPQLQEALAALEAREAELEMAQEDLNRTIIRAPYDGMVREKVADIGQYVNVGSQLSRTFAVDRAEVRLPISQQDLTFLDLRGLEDGIRLPVTLRATIGSQVHVWSAELVRSEGVFDAMSRVLYVVAQVEDPYDLAGTGREPLRMGTFVSAEISGNAGGNLFAIPRHALSRGDTIWIVDEQLRIQPRQVGIVRTDEELAYVESGLADGERYATTPIDQPLPGMQVRLSDRD